MNKLIRERNTVRVGDKVEIAMQHGAKVPHPFDAGEVVRVDKIMLIEDEPYYVCSSNDKRISLVWYKNANKVVELTVSIEELYEMLGLNSYDILTIEE